jgi:multidrug transporter EmrE-like cation transporter
MKLKLNFVFVILCILLQAAGGIFGKYTALNASDMSLLAIISNSFYLLFILCLILQALFWQQALIYYPLSFAYPFMSLVNFVVLIASYFLFQESVTLNNFIGLILISIGISLLSRNSGDSS